MPCSPSQPFPLSLSHDHGPTTCPLYGIQTFWNVEPILHSNDPKEVRSKHFLGELHAFPEGVMPIGRLDAKSEGLLLLTTDGKLSDFINRSGVEKQYYAQLDGEIDENALNLLRQGVEIGLAGQKLLSKPKEVLPLPCPPTFPAPDPSLRIGRHRPTSWVSITLTEGKFRQVRKMTAAAGFPTLRLVRIRIGDIYLDDMVPGEVRPAKRTFRQEK